ncbi:hypothetical protein [Caenimonas sedimenti]|nr:hypothetical protein [Caenimonas sedimenti]
MPARAKKALAYGAAIAALLGVFVLYTRPQMMVALSDFMWACFN